MITYLEGWDPGGATGYVRGFITETLPFTVVEARTLTPRGVMGQIASWQRPRTHEKTIRIVEDFRLRASNRFTADLNGDQLIGMFKFSVFLGWTDPIVWQEPKDKAHVLDQVLKDGGLWRTGRDVNAKTGRHVNDAIIHVLKYLKVEMQHEPTLRKYWG